MKLQDYIQNKPILETDRLLLRPLQYGDAADLKEWLGDKSLYQYWGKRPGKGDLNPELLFQKRNDLQRVSIGGLFIKRTIK